VDGVDGARLPDRVADRWRSILPNGVTFLRVALVPVVLVLLAVGDEFTTARWLAFWVFVFAALTDTFDGWVARRLGGVTAFGALADPLADKLLVVGTLASLALFAEVPWWMVVVVTAREVAVTVLRVVVLRRSGVVVPATIWGKIKTVAQIVAVAAVILPLLPAAVADLLLLAAVVLTVVSGLDYLVRAGALTRTATLDARMGLRGAR
jgi:CDP-diacylglycerol---glycerol-3-phosphate 3-phosphatidyltransferase